jgi:hypothetical protein
VVELNEEYGMKFLRGSGERVIENQNEELPEGVLRDKRGKPLLFHRGSSLSALLTKEEKYQLEHLGHSTGAPSAGEAFFFTSRRKTADYYARGPNPNKDKAVMRGGEPHIDDVYLIMRNPLIHDFKGKLHRDEEHTYFNLIRKAKKDGHDGVIFKNTYDGGEYTYIDVALDRMFASETICGVFNKDQVLVQKTESLISPRRKADLVKAQERDFERRRKKRKKRAQ